MDVYPSGDAFPDVHPYIPGTPHNPPSAVSLQYPIALTPRQKANYFTERQSFNVLGMLQNPMILMMAAMGVLVLGLPYLIVSLSIFLTLRSFSEAKCRRTSIPILQRRSTIGRRGCPTSKMRCRRATYAEGKSPRH